MSCLYWWPECRHTGSKADDSLMREWIVKGAQISKNTRDLACRNTLKLVIVWQETCQRQENATPVVFVARRENKVGMKDQQQFSLLVSFTSFKARPYSCEQNNTFWWISVSTFKLWKKLRYNLHSATVFINAEVMKQLNFSSL